MHELVTHKEVDEGDNSDQLRNKKVIDEGSFTQEERLANELLQGLDVELTEGDGQYMPSSVTSNPFQLASV